MGARLFLMCALFCSTALAAFDQVPRGARSAGLGGTMVAVKGDIWGMFVNPACLSPQPWLAVAVEYVPAQFGLWELKRGAVSLARNTPVGVIALAVSGFGFELYHEHSLGLAFSASYNERFAAGVGLDWYSIGIQGYGNDHAAGIHVGLHVQVVEDVSYGVGIRNLNRPYISRDAESLPQSIAMGLNARPVRNALLALSVGKDAWHPAELRLGLEYALRDLLTLRIGTGSEPANASVGIGFLRSPFCVDYAYVLHPDLGGTHYISLSIDFSPP
jgi:hypothetical protein